jgi:hypothetical protein
MSESINQKRRVKSAMHRSAPMGRNQVKCAHKFAVFCGYFDGRFANRRGRQKDTLQELGQWLCKAAILCGNTGGEFWGWILETACLIHFSSESGKELSMMHTVH